MCGDMLWQDNTQQLEVMSILEANHRCQAHVQFKGNPGSGGLVPLLQALVSMLKSVRARPSAGISFPTFGRQLHVASNFTALHVSHARTGSKS